MKIQNLLYILFIKITIFLKLGQSEEEELEYVTPACSPLMQSDLKQSCIRNYGDISSKVFLGTNDGTEKYAVYTFWAGYFITHSDSIVFDCLTLAVYREDEFICFDKNETRFINLGKMSKLSCADASAEVVETNDKLLRKCNLSTNVSFIANHNPSGNFRISKAFRIELKSAFQMPLVILLNYAIGYLIKN